MELRMEIRTSYSFDACSAVKFWHCGGATEGLNRLRSRARQRRLTFPRWEGICCENRKEKNHGH